jgi:hypothetical protein
MKGIGSTVAVLLVAAIVWFLWESNRAPSFRYRLTVAVASGGETYESSGVIEVKVKLQEYWSPPSVRYVTGDAVVIEVPDRPPVFVLMSARNNADWDAGIAYLIFRDRLPIPVPPRTNAEALAALRETREIPRDKYPTFVAFRDLNRPDTVYEASPDDMSPPFDPGARVVRMAVEMTGDRPTFQVDAVLPWISEFENRYLDGGRLHRFGGSFANSLTSVDFKKRGT